MLQEIEILRELQPEAISFTALLINLLTGTVLALVLRWHFQKYGSTLSNKQEFSKIFLTLVLTTVLVITVVKSSLALSLGLVGALSIVRFRTPIKEPEELVYLFLAIGIGLGLGASQTVITVISASVILLSMAIFRSQTSAYSSDNVFLSIGSDEGKLPFDTIHEIVSRHVDSGNLRRFEINKTDSEICYMISVSQFEQVNQLALELGESFPAARVSFVDQHNLPRV